VACFFERLGVPLFDKACSPGSVSPNKLARSKLVWVKDAVVRRRTIADFVPVRLNIAGAATGNLDGIDFGARMMRNKQIMFKKLQDLDALTKQMRKRSASGKFSVEVMEGNLFKLWKRFRKVIQYAIVTDDSAESAKAACEFANGELRAIGNSLLRWRAILESRSLRRKLELLGGKASEHRRRELRGKRQRVLQDCREALRLSNPA
jgi:hypothetical protein